MEDLCLFVKRSSIQMVVWKPDVKSLFIFLNVLFLNGPPSHDFTIWILETHTVQYSGVWYSDGYVVPFSKEYS